jgi:hypothetical protein
MLKQLPFFLLICMTISGFPQIKMVVKSGGFLFMEGNDSIFFYQKSPKDKGGEFSRCNYIHPLYGPDGTRLTEDFPVDHPHHRGVFWAWHQILIDNKPISDGWELKNFQQKVSSFEYILQKGIGVIKATVDWKSPLWNSGEKAYLQEKTTIFIHPKIRNFRRIDFEIQLKSLTDRLQLGGSDDEKGYGGFSVRLKLPEDITFSSEKGVVQPSTIVIDAGNSLNMNGSFLKNEKPGGVVIYNNPQNPVPSTNWIIRKSASMQNAVFPGRKVISLLLDEPLVIKYTLLVYQGSIKSKQIKKAVK